MERCMMLDMLFVFLIEIDRIPRCHTRIYYVSSSAGVIVNHIQRNCAINFRDGWEWQEKLENTVSAFTNAKQRQYVVLTLMSSMLQFPTCINP